jgi:FtsP/CotA-like multicopper oxidase with cupredoxin domain
MSRLSALRWCVPVLLVLPAATSLPRSLATVSVRAPERASNGAPAVATANDNRRAAGTRRGDTLVVALDVGMGRWYPEAANGPFIDTPVISEAGRAPQIPAPLLRVREGTTIVARLTNRFTDSTVIWHGFSGVPGMDSVRLKPGETVERRFTAPPPGTYLYGAAVGTIDRNERERETSLGAFVVDARGARTDDRVFVMNIWGEPVDSLTYRNALAINGRGWPYDERITANTGDTLRWRIVNATVRAHPMHLHGFYFRLLGKQRRGIDSAYAPEMQPMVVTETMGGFSAMRMEWVAERPGNWLFHCHLSFHVIPETRFTPDSSHTDHHSADAGRHMAGLVLGIEVKDGRRTVAERRPSPRRMRLHVQERRAPAASVTVAASAPATRALGFVLEQGAAPATDSVVLPGTTLVLQRGQPTDITVINHLDEATAVHWHGIELESRSDGVVGWSGTMKQLMSPVAPRDSFVARLTLPRAGTFIYHTHLNDVVQLTSGLYGAMVVLEPGQTFDPVHDHVLVFGSAPNERLLVNGDSLPGPLTLAAGAAHRLRLVFIGPVNGDIVSLEQNGRPVTWTRLARDGYELPAAQQLQMPATIRGWAGQTYDYGIRPAAGRYQLVARTTTGVTVWQRDVIVP